MPEGSFENKKLWPYQNRQSGMWVFKHVPDDILKQFLEKYLEEHLEIITTADLLRENAPLYSVLKRRGMPSGLVSAKKVGVHRLYSDNEISSALVRRSKHLRERDNYAYVTCGNRRCQGRFKKWPRGQRSSCRFCGGEVVPE